jgi:hypothetical protein
MDDPKENSVDQHQVSPIEIKQKEKSGLGVTTISILSTLISLIALIATIVNAHSSYSALQFNQRATMETQQAALFAQFQHEYSSVNSRFPAAYLDPKFQPVRGSDDYARLQSYWIFCYSEWYATNKFDPDSFKRLWTDYYSPLVTDGLDIPSLRYVLEDMIKTHLLERGSWDEFLIELSKLARASGKPLTPAAERYLRVTHPAEPG